MAKIVKIKAVRGAATGMEWVVDPEGAKMGRDSSCDIVLGDPSVSREHAVISTSGGKVLITDLGSRNGITINGKPVSQGAIVNGDYISVGSAVLCVVIRQE